MANEWVGVVDVDCEHKLSHVVSTLPAWNRRVQIVKSPGGCRKGKRVDEWMISYWYHMISNDWFWTRGASNHVHQATYTDCTCVALFMVYGLLSFENWAADNWIFCKNGFTILTRPGLKRTCPLREIGSIFVFFMLHWMAYFGWNLLIPRGNEGLESRRGRWWCDHRKASRHRGKSLGIGTEVESWWPMVELVGVLITTRLHHVPWFIRDAHYE